MPDEGYWDKLSQLWPARAAKGLWEGLMLPGDVAQGNVSMWGDDGRTNPQVINRAADLAGAVTLGAGAMPAAAGELRAGIRSYQNVPDSLMGYRRDGPQKGFGETNYSHKQPVEVTFKNGDTFMDTVEGMNANHAVERAYRNWPDAIHITAK